MRARGRLRCGRRPAVLPQKEGAMGVTCDERCSTRLHVAKSTRDSDVAQRSYTSECFSYSIHNTERKST